MPEINWYPGHMAKTRRILADQLASVDAVIELCDARAPQATRNPDLNYLCRGKTRILILNKADLADDAVTSQWMAHYRDMGLKPIRFNSTGGHTRDILAAIEEACAPAVARMRERGVNKTARLMVIGIPTVGKSTFINRIFGRAIAQAGDTPGVTRDRIYGECEWRGRKMILVDTGGIEPKTDDLILSQMKAQAELAVESADVIIFLCDVRAGLTADDREIAVYLKKSGKPVILCVNKCDNIGDPPMEFYEFYELGFRDDPIGVSGSHGNGTGDLLDACVDALNEQDEKEEEEDDSIKVAVIGKPNAGKSSIINRFLGENRLIVSEIAGTTRDAVDTEVTNAYGKFTFIDTAGIRKQSKIEDKIEHFSVLRAHMAVERAQVCLLMIDATTGITDQDTKIAGIAHEAGKATIIVVNKWDLVEKDNSTVNEFNNKIRTELAYMTYAPILYVSAKTGFSTSTASRSCA